MISEIQKTIVEMFAVIVLMILSATYRFDTFIITFLISLCAVSVVCIFVLLAIRAVFYSEEKEMPRL